MSTSSTNSLEHQQKSYIFRKSDQTRSYNWQVIIGNLLLDLVVWRKNMYRAVSRRCMLNFYSYSLVLGALPTFASLWISYRSKVGLIRIYRCSIDVKASKWSSDRTPIKTKHRFLVKIINLVSQETTFRKSAPVFRRHYCVFLALQSINRRSLFFNSLVQSRDPIEENDIHVTA